MTHLRTGLAVFWLVAGLILVAGDAVAAGFWGRLDSLFSAPPVQAPYAEVIAEESKAYLDLKSDVFQPSGELIELVQLDEPRRITGPGGESLTELRSYAETQVTAAVDFSSEDYSYSAGDPLMIRVYSAILFELAQDGGVVRHLYKPLALRNMSNPRSRDEEMDLFTSLAEADSFSQDEIKQWLATQVHKGEHMVYGERPEDE